MANTTEHSNAWGIADGASKHARGAIFRPIAVAAAAGTQIGEPLATHWRGVALVALCGFALTAGLLVFAATTEYSPVHRVPSYVDARGGVVRLNSPISGRVRELTVEQGARVRRGALLAVIDSDRLRADGSSQHDALSHRLEDERATLDREIAAGQREADASDTLMVRKLHGLRAERDALGAQLRTAEELLTSLQAQSELIASVAARGYVPKLQAVQKKDDVTAQQSRLAELRSDLTRIDLDIATTEAERQVVAAKFAGQAEQRRRSSAELGRMIAQSDSDAEQAVRAPADGLVSTALIASGQSVATGQPLFTITPIDQSLIVRLLIPARAAASVKVGLNVKLVFRAYPQEKFGQFAARVESVSESPALPGEIEQMYALSEPAFIATASLPGQLFAPDGRPLRIKAGMLADALVPIERRSVLEWLFEPVLRGFHQSADGSSSATQAKRA